MALCAPACPPHPAADGFVALLVGADRLLLVGADRWSAQTLTLVLLW